MNSNAVANRVAASFWGMGLTQFAGGFASEGSILVPKIQADTPTAPYSAVAATNGIGCSLFVRHSPSVAKKLQLCIMWPGAADPVVLAESETYP
jgi:hypothetical protein